jgi:hypothetical protein
MALLFFGLYGDEIKEEMGRHIARVDMMKMGKLCLLNVPLKS